ncbi:hypothetical protein [Cellulomonas marina]|uniref:Alpha-galactosidase n=1 Tax=Cellulomonas marina TaxID=988821 RepID=A0A1I1A9I7_9CELL|nr:hypothetical protein [Cellulomonas marina]GIG29566.1 hypothetical protein Cma02nite_21660 [Cellulomonas marina]SFB33150.1 hypothetical protein SAMN05421867_11535 [Cellulomonas marina]
MHVQPGPGTHRDIHRVTAAAYLLEVRAHPPRAVLAGTDGRIWAHLSLLASVDRTDLVDESLAVGAPTVRQHVVAAAAGGPGDEDVVDVELVVATTAWERTRVRLRCHEDHLVLTVTVEGRGTLADVRLLGGRAVLDTGACGSFRSLGEHRCVYVPTPTEPVQVVRAATAAASLGVVGDATAGRLHAVFSPPPLCLVLGRAVPAGPTQVPVATSGQEWLSVGLVAPVVDLRLTELRYEPLDDGFHLVLDHDGHTHVDGTWTSPELHLRPVPDPVAALRQHREDHVVRGWAPAGPSSPPVDWWSEPLFCGWGAQCARAPLPGAPALHPTTLDALGPEVVPPGAVVAPDLARQDVYDELLAHLAAHDVDPGTVVVDDRWQAAYGTAEPDPDRWPDLRGWVAGQHAAGRRVLLWWKAWDPEGLPVDECVTDARGRAVAADPSSPAYAARVRATVAALLGPDGVDADGFKVDFTQRSPAGHGLRRAAGVGPDAPWGVAGLHALLALLHDAAKAAKPDALLVTHTPHPGFADVTDMVRLNDVLERDPAGAVAPLADQLRARAAVVAAVLPHHLVDTDQWPMLDRAQWRAYVAAQAGLGVHALYYAERIDRSGEPLTADDLALVARTWAEYRASRRAARPPRAAAPAGGAW